ncbi:MAG: hypothetical protein K0Q91_728 [Fibrobacteria bacterium]|jgi:hypothetical protein|nr:hypothetical protein [Fibrobacteria bacterium]
MIPRFLVLLLPLALAGCFMPEPEGIPLQCIPPEIVQVTPPPGATDVPLDEDITITFTLPLDSASVNPETFVVLEEDGDTVPGEVTYDPQDTTAVFDPVDSLLPDETYTVIVTPEVTDTLGIGLDTVYTWTFTTEEDDPEPPDGIGEVFPKDGEDDVPLDEEIFVHFDTVFNPVVFDTNAIVVTLGDDTIPGTVTYDPGDSTLVFDPVDSLLPETTYVVTVTYPSDSVTAMGPVDTTITWTFTTVDSIPKSPILEAINNGSTYSLSLQTDAFLRLYWFPATGPTATTYHLQVSASPTFATLAFDAPGLPNNSFIVSKKVPHASLSGGVHYWRVRASNSGGDSPWSTVWTFTVTP